LISSRTHLALFGYVVGIESRAQTQVGNDVESDGEMVVENFGVGSRSALWK